MPSAAVGDGVSPAVSWREYAHSLGFVRVGVARVDRETLAREADAKAFTQSWVERGYHASLDYLRPARCSPTDLLPGARSVVVFAAPTETVALAPPPPGTGHVAAYARGLDYHQVLKAKAWSVAQCLADEKQSTLTARVCVDTAPILERFWAQEAGVTFTGKSTMAIAPGVGTTVLLALLIVDVPLTANEPLPGGCGECTLCLDACPTAAFPAAFVLDAGRCISYLTIENSGGIPEEHRAALSHRVFGCDECQTVCPYNTSRKRPGPLPELAARPTAEVVDLRAWATLTSGDYKRLTKGSALRRAPRAQLQRNAVVALGNQACPAPEDERVLSEVAAKNPNPVVRKHAAWALLRLNPTLAPGMLLELCETETDPEVLSELRRLLESAVPTRRTEGSDTPDTRHGDCSSSAKPLG